jgi:hypothetical protein
MQSWFEQQPDRDRVSSRANQPSISLIPISAETVALIRLRHEAGPPTATNSSPAMLTARQ